MAATGKTPILLYGSTTATNTPVAGNLTNSSDGCEIAINVADKNLFFKDSTNVVNTVPIRQSSASSNGWLSSTDWSTFNSKQPAGTYVTSVTGTAPVVSSGGTTPAISMAAATSSVNGYLTSTDWTTFNNKAPAFTYTSGYIPFGQGTTTPTQSVNLFWDAANNALGIGTTAPASYLGKVTVFGNVAVALGSKTYYWDASSSTGSYITNKNNSSVAFGKYQGGGDVEYGYFDNTANLHLNSGSLKIDTAGQGIDFSATAGTGTSELLADYEEGTWTPTQGAGLTLVGAFSSTGKYTKVGRQVTVIGTLTGGTSVAAASGQVMCAGLPYSVVGDSTGSFNNFNLDAGGSVYLQSTNVYAVGAIAATKTIYFTATYFV